MSKFVYILEGHQSVSEFDTREQALEAAKADALDAWGLGNFGPIYTARLAPLADSLKHAVARIGWRASDCVISEISDALEDDSILMPLSLEQELAFGEIVITWLADNGVFIKRPTTDLQQHPYATPAGAAK